MTQFLSGIKSIRQTTNFLLRQGQTLRHHIYRSSQVIVSQHSWKYFLQQLPTCRRYTLILSSKLNIDSPSIFHRLGFQTKILYTIFYSKFVFYTHTHTHTYTNTHTHTHVHTYTHIHTHIHTHTHTHTHTHINTILFKWPNNNNNNSTNIQVIQIVIILIVSTFSSILSSIHGSLNLLGLLVTWCSMTFKVQQLYVLPTLYWCILYLYENKQRLVPLTA